MVNGRVNGRVDERVHERAIDGRVDIDAAFRLVENLSTALQVAVAADDEPTCSTLVPQRGAALEALGALIRDLDPKWRASLSARLTALAADDSRLQDAAQAALARTGEAVRAGFGLGGRNPGTGDAAAAPTDIDRLA